MDEKTQTKCSFCGLGSEEVNRFVAGAGAYICNICVNSAFSILNAESQNLEQEFNDKLLNFTPKMVKRNLDDYVIGQNDAKKVLSVAIYNHHKRLYFNKEEIGMKKNNVMLIGSTGVGKTLLVKTLAKNANLPFVIADATSFTEAGYVGEDVDSILTRLLEASGGDLVIAQKGIVFIDEIDKLASKQSGHRDVSGLGVQQALLKLIEGSVCSVSTTLDKKDPNGRTVMMSTDNILFILGGAFSGIEEIIKKRVRKTEVGFNTKISNNKKDELLKQINTGDLVKYGIMYEFIGRISNIVTLNDLSKNDIVKIITKPKDSIIKQYKNMFRLENVELEITEEAVNKIAEISLEKKTGARGISNILENTMTELMFEIPSNKTVTKIKIDESVIEGTKKAIIIKKDKNVKSA